jgi:hypothetical protein
MSFLEQGASNHHDCLGFFKPSKQKKCAALSFIPTNCHVHTSMVWMQEIAELPKHNFLKPGALNIASITFGAPTAFSLGFKEGGLQIMNEKILMLQKQHENSLSSGSPGIVSPEATLARLQLGFDLRAREAIVVSQALGAVVAASSEFFLRAVTDHNTDVIRQVARIGLLLHSVCLLSTSGDEEAMLNDFTAVYKILKLTLRFEQATATNLSANAFNEASVKLSVGGILENNDHIGTMTVRIKVEPLDAFQWMVATAGIPVDSHLDINVVPILFNLGNRNKLS